MADIEFVPDYESDFAKEVFSRLNDKNKYDFKTKRRDENKVEIDSKVFTFLKNLIEEQLENEEKYSILDESPDHKVSSHRLGEQTIEVLLKTDKKKNYYSMKVLNER